MVKTDASNYAIAGILSITSDDSHIHPVAFFSWTLLALELNYDMHDKELLAIFEAFWAWQHYLKGASLPIDVVTDHKNLEYFSTSKRKLRSRPLQFQSFSARGTPSPITPRAGSSSRHSATTIHRTLDFPRGDKPDGNNPGGDDPGDDDPHNNDEDDEDDNDPFVDAPEDLDPQLAVLQNLVMAVDRLSHSTRRPDDTSSSRAKVREPDTFDGTEPRKLRTFLVQCELCFQDRPRAFCQDRNKVTFAQSYLKGMALEWFEPDLLNTRDPADRPLWMDSWLDFIAELQTTFGPHDPIADAEHQLDHLHMKETHRVNRYVVDFNRLASQVRGYGDGALRHLFYSGLPDRIKDKISRVGKPNTLYGLHALAQEIDARYWERKDKVAQQTKSSGGGSSNNTGSKGNSSKGDKQKSGGNTPASPNTPTLSTSTPKPQNQQSSGQPSGLSNKLGKDG
ncbi:hypothetical protein PISMIDRAFT_17826, partial [Pisolithus microcarpus 441]